MWRKLDDKPRGGVAVGKGNTASDCSRVATTALISARHELDLCKIRRSHSGTDEHTCLLRHDTMYINVWSSKFRRKTLTIEIPVHQTTRRHIPKDWALRLICPVSMAHTIRYRPFTMESGVWSETNTVGKVVLGFSSSSLVFPASLIPPKFTNSCLVNLSPMLYNIRKW